MPTARFRRNAAVALTVAALGGALAACDPAEPGSSKRAETNSGWQVVREDTNVTGMLTDIEIYDAQTMWVASGGDTDEEDYAQLGRWNGRRWARVEIPDALTRSYSLDVYIAAPNDVWVDGDGIWRWNGSAWHRFATPGSPEFGLRGLGIVASGDVWALGEVWTYPKGGGVEDYRTETQAYHWNGRRWRQVAMPQPGAAGCYEIAEIVSSDDIWATGGDPCATGPKVGIAAHWNGRSWTQVPLPKNVRYLGGIAAAGPDMVWALGMRANDEPVILRWTGGTWDEVDAPKLPKELTGFVSDGAGGLWMRADESGGTVFVHRSEAGHWTTTSEVTGSGSRIHDAALVPGTRTLIAVGCENCSFPGPATPLFLRNGPAQGEGAGR